MGDTNGGKLEPEALRHFKSRRAGGRPPPSLRPLSSNTLPVSTRQEREAAWAKVSELSTRPQQDTLPALGRPCGETLKKTSIDEREVIKKTITKKTPAQISGESPGEESTTQEKRVQSTNENAGEDADLRLAVKGLTGMMEKLSAVRASLQEQTTKNLANTTADCKKMVEDVITQLVNEDVPRMIEEKSEKFDNKLDGALAELSSRWTTGLKAEVRGYTAEFIWADIKDTTRLEKKLAELEASVAQWIKYVQNLEQRLTDRPDNMAKRLAAVEKENRELREEVVEMKRGLRELQIRDAAQRECASGLLRTLMGPP